MATPPGGGAARRCTVTSVWELSSPTNLHHRVVHHDQMASVAPTDRDDHNIVLIVVFQVGQPQLLGLEPVTEVKAQNLDRDVAPALPNVTWSRKSRHSSRGSSLSI
jgi:hypothetical protein